MVSALDRFAKSLADESTKQIRGCVERTSALMTRLSVDTIDELAHRLAQGRADESNNRLEALRQRYPRMAEAKLAVSALFLSLEKAAVAGGLTSYHSLLHRLFPSASGRHYQDRLKRCKANVFSFNYDRLFEISFCRHFEVEERYAFYGTLGLNSGVQAFHNENLEFDDGRFSFLKLHGSVGMFAYDDDWGMRHGHLPLTADGSAAPTDADLFEVNRDRTVSSEPRSSLIFFPHEKEYLLSGEETRFPYRNYAKQVWQRAEQIAAQASEIWLIGYSICETDFPYTMGLLRAAKGCKRIVIQSTHPDPIYQKLKVRAKELSCSLEVYAQSF